MLKDFTVLCAEDESNILNVITEMISPHVKQLIKARNGEEAYNLYKRYNPDIIITDINMPKISGLELVKMIRENDYETKVIVLTAYSDVNTLLEATELRLTKYLVKPISIKELYAALVMAADEKDNIKITTTNKIDLDDNYHWDFKEKLLIQNEQEIHLTPKEREILHILFSNINTTITYDKLIYEVWEDSELYSIDTVKTMIKNLRKKLPKDTIQNVYGTGFKVKK